MIKFSSHALAISLYGSLIAFFLFLFLSFIQKYNFELINFFLFHYLSFAFILVFPLAETSILAILTILLRENILMAKQQAEKGSRFSLLSDLGIIKPKRQFSLSIKKTLIFTTTSILSWCIASLLPLTGLPLAYFMLFLFAMAIGSLIVDELAIAKKE
ncbi:hypothetical protein QEJ31_03390 [Pigmentibacter sp. JX0631]|uniref:hypothetical protein n=1 Tax=Pigmentibacter sp. JX0631 TaxID=2976982 RepID=UPI0024689DF6|nr:hypothetical protein [Pigmentibacter sp. JX0631]WGL60646.1 hypothetical protein QEJ31_03390 [Pigmentibacter sp. JX0631]